MTPKEIADKAVEIVTQGRNEEYGGPEDSFWAIARLWTAYLDIRNPGDLGPEDVALMMDLMKTARLVANPDHGDSIVDKIGYSLCYAKCAGLCEDESSDINGVS